MIRSLTVFAAILLTSSAAFSLSRTPGPDQSYSCAPDSVTFAPLPTVGDTFFSGKRYRLILLFLAPNGTSTEAPNLLRNRFLPGRIPSDTGSTPQWALRDTVLLHEYLRDAVTHFFDEYSRGELEVVVDVPMVDTADTPVWEMPEAQRATVALTRTLGRVAAVYPDYFEKPDSIDYQRIGYLFTSPGHGQRTALSTPFNSFADLRGRYTITDDASFALQAWAGMNHPVWNDAPTHSLANDVVHEFLHHLTYAHRVHTVIGDRGTHDYGTRTWGFDIMDHNGKPESTNGHYGCHPLAPLDQYFFGFIGDDETCTITENARNVRIEPAAGEGSGTRLVRIPLSTGTESFIIANHQGRGVDEAYNAGLENTPVVGLEVWHVADGYVPSSVFRGMREKCDVEVAWTLAGDGVYRHPDGERTWPVAEHLPEDYSLGYDWVECTIADNPFSPPPATPSTRVLNGAYGGFSAGSPGESQGYCNREYDNAETLRWTLQYDRETGFPTPRDFFREGMAFTPYTDPSTDFFHFYETTGDRSAAQTCSLNVPPQNIPRDGEIDVRAPVGPSRLGITDIRQESDGAMSFDVWFHFWEGEFSHAANFGSDSTDAVWEPLSLAGVEHTTVVVGPNGFTVPGGKTLTVRSGMTVRCLGDLTVEGALTVEDGAEIARDDGTELARRGNGIIIYR